jgi:hypothetical protein
MGKTKKPSSRFFGLWACSALTIMGLATGWAVPLLGQTSPAEEAFQPQLITAQTRADPKKLAILQKPGKVFFEDGFESPDSLEKYFEIRGLKEGRAKMVSDPKLAHSGKGAIQFTAPANDGRESGAGASGWFGPEGYDRVYFRRYIKFAADYDQGNLNHTGGSLAAVAGADRWRAMGSAGIRPKGDDHFNSAFEPWRDWGRYPAPGYMFLYTYWVDMQRDPDGHFWGNMLGPQDSERMVLQRDRWYCLEHMIQVNDAGKANGELAAWIDGKLYIHYTGIRWRTSDAVKLKRFDIGVYVHQARKDNTVWYDDVALSTGYIGPTEGPEIKPAAPAGKQAEGAP